MAQSRRNMPPYEVMSSGLATLGTQDSVRLTEVSTAAPQSDGEYFEAITSVRPAGMWSRLLNPVVLRVPRGYAVLLGAALAALVAMAYWVGHHRGSTHATMANQADLNAEDEVMRHATALVADPIGTARPVGAPPPLRHTVDPTGDADIVSSGGKDPRKRGLNYLVLASDNQSGATRLLDFLWGHGIEAAAYRYKNHGLFTVVAIEKGFAAGELRGKEYRQYYNRLKQLGQKWEATVNGARSFIKQGMLADKYEGEAYTAMIVRKDRL